MLLVVEVRVKSNREIIEEIFDEFWGSLNSDLEHGVKILNQNASEKFKKDYPALYGFSKYLSNLEDELGGSCEIT